MEKIKRVFINKPDKSAKKHPDNRYEQLYFKQNKVVCGIDEVGRGCLAGPVVVAAATLHTQAKHPLLRDSKLLSPSELQVAYDWIIPRCSFAVAWGHQGQIDTLNIYQATLRAMKRAYMQLYTIADTKPSVVLVDAMPLKFDGIFDESPEVISLIKGESQSRSIAAASIIAKVTRDRMIRSMDLVIPGYRFSDHKGYGTAVHKKSLALYGPSLLHRTTFLSNTLKKQDGDDYGTQQTIC